MTYEDDNPLFCPPSGTKDLKERSRQAPEVGGENFAPFSATNNKKLTGGCESPRTSYHGLCRVVPSRRYGQPLPVKNRDTGQIYPVLRETIRACLDGKSYWPLFIHGEPGSGKTCAGLLACDFYGGLYTTLEDWCDRIRQAKAGELRYWAAGQGGLVDERAAWKWMSAPFAVIDDIGERETSDFRTSTFKRSLDIREQLPTILISNLNLSGIQAMYGPRVRSRVGAGTTIRVSGDRRKRATNA